jgi:glycosyltransferase involved in cell wall biosynthesis
MSLQDKHFLIDGYNLQLRKGTGIKTYGRALIQTLHSLGARVSVLWSAPRSRVAVVQEALLEDAHRPAASLLSCYLAALKPLIGLARRASGHRPTGWPIPLSGEASLYPYLHKSYFVPNCYGVANRLFSATGRSMPVRLPDPVDVWHSTYPLPVTVRGAPKITTVHDLIPLRLPWATLDDKRFFYKAVRNALARSALVVADSESARNDIVETFKVRPERVEVLYGAVSSPAEVLPEREVARQLSLYGLRPNDYLLFVGSIQPRKNLGRLCQALTYLDTRVPLVVVGGKGWLWKNELRFAKPLLARKQLTLLDHVPAGHLRALYSGALALAFPSLYEGFGLPPLEAMAHDCPVLCGNTSSLPEVCGDAAVYADPYSVADLAEKIDALLRDGTLRRQLSLKGRERVQRFSLDRYRSRLVELYSKVLD